MQEIIRDGALRLMTSESTCDVILNCQGHRLMAHKVMLSIASPLLQELLLADQSETSLVVLPDITASTMTYILDYIYTGRVLLHSTVLSEFLSTANLLKLKIESETPMAPIDNHPKQSDTPQNYSNKYYSKFSTNYEPRNDVNYNKTLINCEYKNQVGECGPECYKTVYQNSFKNNSVEEKIYDFKMTEKRLKFSPIILQDERNPNLINGNRQIHEEKLNKLTPSVPTLINEINEPPALNNFDLTNNNNSNNNNNILPKKRTTKKLPNLMPITRYQFSAFKARKGLYNRVFPSPWCPRIIPVTGDPRNDCIRTHMPTPVQNGSFPNADSSKENLIETQEEHNDKNNNLKRLPYVPLNAINNVPPAEKNIQPIIRTFDSVALNLNTTYKEPNQNNFPPIRKSPPGDRISLPPKKQYVETTEPIIDKPINDYQNIPSVYPVSQRISDSTFSSTESNSSCGDAKSGEESTKMDRSDEDNGKEDGEMSDQKQKPYKCEDCGKQFSQLRNYKYHRSVHEGTKEFAARCPECGKVFNDRGYLSSHLKIHRDRKEYGCPHCPKRFNQRVAYNMHLRIHTGVKPHVCPTCGKGFSRKMLLKQHQRVHTGERPYQCPECGKSFADRSNMSLHARLHTGVKPYACNLCPKSFTKKHHLKTHMNYHTGLKPYVCQKCGLTFSQSSNMRTHYKKCIQKETNNDANKTVTVNQCT